MTLMHELKANKEQIIDIAGSHGAIQISVFGSVAEQKDGPDSDIDFLVELEDNRSLLDLVAIKQDLEELLGRKVDVVTRNSVHHKLRDNIIKKAVRL